MITETDKFIPEFSVALSSRLAKSFDVNLLGADRFQHSIEPTVTYTYVPDEEQGSLPLFDLRDRVASRNDVTYALVNRLTARSQAADGSSSYRDLFYLRLSQSYNIDEPQAYIEDGLLIGSWKIDHSLTCAWRWILRRLRIFPLMLKVSSPSMVIQDSIL